MKNEKSWRCGQSGNPGGRPKTSSLSLAELLRAKVNKPATKAAIANELIRIATKGSNADNARLKALALILAELEGRPAQRPAKKVDENVLVIEEDATQTS